MSEHGRQSKRHPSNHPLLVQCESWAEFAELYATDVSQGGMFIATDEPPPILSEIGIKHLAYYEDPTTDVFQDLKRYGRSIIGLPATVLIGRDGCELGVLPGPAEWASEDALNLIRAATGG